MLDRYVGAYQLNPQLDLIVERDGDHLTARPGGQNPIVLQPMSETAFFNDGMSVEVEFIVEDGEVVAAVVRQGLRKMRAERKP